MKRLLVVLALLAVGSSVLVAARIGRDPAQRTLTIKVTSTNPNQEFCSTPRTSFNQVTASFSTLSVLPRSR